MFGIGGGSRQQNTIFEQRDDLTQYGGLSTIVLLSQNQRNEAVFNIRGSYGDQVQGLWIPSPPYFEWHHYAAVVSSDKIKYYIDGVLLGLWWKRGASQKGTCTGDSRYGDSKNRPC